MAKNHGGINAGDFADLLFKQLKAAKEGAESYANDAGEQVGKNFADGIEQGFEDAASIIEASSVKITKAFKDLAKKVTNQKDVLNISLGGRNVVVDVDFSDIDIDSDEIQKKINDIFEKIKIDSAIEFDTKAEEKYFKDILGLRTKYATKLGRLQNSSRKITTSHARGVNAQEQLAVMAAIGEVDDSIRSVVSKGNSVRLPKVYFESVEVLRDRAELVELSAKREEVATKKAETAQKAYAKKNKELERENVLLREQNRLLGGNGSIDSENAGSKSNARGKQKTPRNALPDYSMAPKKGKVILYHNTSSENVDSILKSGIRADAGKEHGRGKDGDYVWATTTPNQKGYGGNTIAFQIDVKLLADNKHWKANDDEYHITKNIPAEDILFVDRPVADNQRESDIVNLVRRLGADKVRDVLGRRKLYGGMSMDRVEELIEAALSKQAESIQGDYNSPARPKPDEMGKWKKAKFYRYIKGKNGPEQILTNGRTDGNYNYHKDETLNKWTVTDAVTGLAIKHGYSSYKSAQEDVYSDEMQEKLSKATYDHKQYQQAIEAMQKAQAQFNNTKAQEPAGVDAEEQKRMAEEAAAKAAEEARLAKEQEEADRRVAELARQRAEEEAKLARQKAEEEAFNAEMEAAVAEAMEAELKAEQEELKVEKEITKEQEKQYGYHAGKLSTDGHKSENLFNSQPGRDTGYYGTGFYATDKAHLGEIMSGQYGRKPLSVVDPDGYNLFDATNDKTAGQLHKFLKSVTYKAFGKKGENIKSLYAEFKNIFPAEQIITYEDFKSLIGELQQYVKEYGDKYPLNTRMDSVSTKFMKNFGYEGVDVRGTKYADTTYGMVIYDLKEESIVLKEITDEMQKQEIAAGNIASVIENQNKAQENASVNKAAEENKIVKEQVEAERRALEIAQQKAEEEARITAEKEKQLAAQTSSGYHEMSRQDASDYLYDNNDHKLWNRWYSGADDAARTEIAGILEKDIKLRNAALNQMWDTYKQYTGKDIGFEDFLNTKIPLYRGEPLDSQSRSEKALSLSLTPEAAEEFGHRVLEIWMKPIDTLGMANPTDTYQPEAEVMVLKALVPQYDKWRRAPAMAERFSNITAATKFSTRDYERLYDEMEAFAAQRRAENGYDLSRVTVNTDAHGNPLGATIAYYKKATKESIVETYKLDEASQEAEESINRLVLSSRKATAGISDFEKATLQAINRQDQLIAQKNKTVSSLSSVLDPNANRSLAGTDYEEEASRRIQAIKDEVAKLDQVDSAGERIILSEKDFLAIKRRIAELTQDARDFINASKNAEYAPTQLESHSVSSGNKYRKDQLSAYINEWKRAGIYAGDLQVKAEELANSVDNITKHEDLKKYLEGLKEARALATLANQDKRAEAERQKPIIERQKQEQSYSDWWNKALFTREQQEKAKDERIIEARKKKEQAYVSWWEKALKMKDVAAQREADKQSDKEKKKANLPYLNYGKTTANSAVRKRDVIQGSIDALGVTNPKVLAQMDAYKAKVQEIIKIREQFEKDPNAAQDSTLVKQFQKSSYEAEQLRRNIKEIVDEEQRMAQMSIEQGFDPIELSADQLSNLKNEMIEFANAGAQGRVEIKGWNADNTKMYYTVTDSKGAVQEMTAALGQGTNQLYKMRTATKETGTLFQQIFKGITVKAKELISYVIGGGSVYKVISMLRQGVQYVRDIDLALTELKKVTDATEESYDKFLKTAAKTADKVGSTIKDVVSSTADWARLGYSMEQAAKFAETTQILMNVSEFTDVSQATDTLISAVQAFGYTADTSMDVVDLLNTIGRIIAYR